MTSLEYPRGFLAREPSAHLVGNREAIIEIQDLYIRYNLDHHDPLHFVQWAIERLEREEEGDDLDIVLLADLQKGDRARDLIDSIFQRYCGLPANDWELIAGKRLVLLQERYFAGSESIESLSSQIRSLSHGAGLPGWMFTLMDLGTYAHVLEPGFREPFEQELEYIAGLWALANSCDEFEELYDPEVSRRHERYRPKRPRSARRPPPTASPVAPPKAFEPDSGELVPAVEEYFPPQSPLSRKLVVPGSQKARRPADRLENLRRRTGRKVCDHEWIEEYDSAADAAAYKDGLNYSPAFEVCRRCGKRRRISDGHRWDWGCVLWFPFILIYLLVVELLLPFILLARAIYDALVVKRRS